ncbi:exported protein of unknown function [Trichlorobacter ammonificans]|uniref:LysM domain-containing protein n=1 Tax=Trichlorobacter ammonificans TaxID=2916410 RepID=A0ABM9D832_9BACT|nr:exported protein of unknown function [Trichlorobacter ammonificans]
MKHAERLAYSATLLALLLGAAPDASPAGADVYAPPGTSFGQQRHHLVRDNESLIEIARHYELGFSEIVTANPGIDPFVPPEGTTVLIPSCRLVPRTPLRSGIVINLPELRLYYFPRDGTAAVRSFPVGIGDEGRKTPLGSFRVTEKIEAPRWHVPRSIRRSRPGLPAVVPPGPENPLGSHALRLSGKALMIHGTNRPFSVGRKASHGCIRLYPEHMRTLFALVEPGTRVAIVNQAVKAAIWNGQVYIEVHDHTPPVTPERVRTVLKNSRLHRDIDEVRLLKAVYEARGIPVALSRTVPPPESISPKESGTPWLPPHEGSRKRDSGHREARTPMPGSALVMEAPATATAARSLKTSAGITPEKKLPSAAVSGWSVLPAAGPPNATRRESSH